jgi:hypothetical protein
MPALTIYCSTCGTQTTGRRNIRLNHDGVEVCSSCFHSYSRLCEICHDTVDRSQGCNTCPTLTECAVCFDMFEGGGELCGTCSTHSSRCGCCNRYTRNRRLEGGWCSTCNSADTWENTGFHDPQPTYRRTLSTRKFGVEIETHRDHNYRQLRRSTSFAATVDGSTDGKEFVSPVLYGDRGLEEILTVTRFARSNDWEVNSSCGLHLHCDVSSEPVENLRKLVFAYHYTYELWTSFISDSRKRNYYCAKHNWNPQSCLRFLNFSDWVERYANERYTWCNWASYNRHKTVELRFHSATLSGDKITKFVKANLRFIDWVCSLRFEQVHELLAGADRRHQFDVISECWGSSVSNFYKRRAESFGKPLVSTPLVGAS